MNQIRTGKFIAGLRRREGMTQEALGEKLGVTNKTVSRWENGNYMPDIEMLQKLGQLFNVSINELLEGQFLTDEEFRQKADEHIKALSTEGPFSLAEKTAYWKRKWRKEHRFLIIFLILAVSAFFIFSLVIHKPWLTGFSLLAALVAYGYQNNRMMIYVENNLYGRIK